MTTDELVFRIISRILWALIAAAAIVAIVFRLI